MATSCAKPPKNKKVYAKNIGQILVRNYGKKKYYSILEVQKTTKMVSSVDWVCWAMCLYVSPSEFDAYHQSIGEICDYSEMRSEMALAITDNASSSWFDADLSWLEWPDFDFFSIFD